MMRAVRLIDVRTPMRLSVKNASGAPYMPRTSLLTRAVNPASPPSRIACARPFRAQWPRRVAPGAAHISETGRLPSLGKMNSNFALFSRSSSRLSPRRPSAIWNGLPPAPQSAASAFLTQSDRPPASQPSPRAASA